MWEIIIWLISIPFMILFYITEFIENPNRDSLIGSQSEIVQENYSWDYLKELISDRYEFGAGVVDNKIYLIGGLAAPT